MRNALPLMLAGYREYGPIFTVRILHGLWVLMIGPEANHYVTVSHAANFRWRDGGMAELRPLVGDGLLTTDGETHRRARRTMNPAFHQRQIAIAGESMTEETLRALSGWRVGDRVDLGCDAPLDAHRAEASVRRWNLSGLRYSARGKELEHGTR